jgi:hypothetical protein
MKLPEPPKIIQTLTLGGYTPELESVSLQVWVNPPVALFARFLEFELTARKNEADLLAATKAEDEAAIKAAVEARNQNGEDRIAWLSEILSQGAEDTRWSADDIKKAFIEVYAKTDPQLFWWVLLSVFMKIKEHRTELKNV